MRPAKGWVDRRDPRFKVLVRVSLRGAGPMIDACVRDVSRRGMLLQANFPPPRGAIIEVVGPFPPVVARVVWASERRFGVTTQDRIKVSDFLVARDQVSPDRDSVGPVCLPSADPDRGERHRQVGRLLQYGAVIAAGGTLAFAIAQAAYGLLANVAAAVEMRL